MGGLDVRLTVGEAGLPPVIRVSQDVCTRVVPFFKLESSSIVLVNHAPLSCAIPAVYLNYSSNL